MKNLRDYLEKLNIDNIDDKMEKFNTFYSLLIEWNNKFNLTNITEKNEVEIKHFIDSITAFNYIEENSYICDIGAGAGFPSIPLAIIKPSCNFILIDSLNKRINFLNEVILKLNLKNCKCIHTRVEDFAIKNKEKFDICLARAVAPTPTLLEYTIPLLKINGKLIAHKGSNIDEEIESSKNALKILNCSITNKYTFNIPNGDNRCILEVTKNNSCPNKYPRSSNKPRLNPL